MKDIQKKTKYPFLLLFASIWLCFIPVFRSKDTKETQDTKKTFAVEESKNDTTHFNEIRNIDVNGVNIVYKVQGENQNKPVILLHGNSGEHDHLSVMINQLDSAGYLVYALDSRGQGANAPLPEYHYIDMANDLHEFIEKLHLNKPAIFGWSDGGNTALQMEVLHPNTAGAIITAGANLFPEGVVASFWEEFKKEMLKDSIPPLTKMMLFEPQMSATDMQSIQCPALIVAGEHDLIDLAHTQLIAESIPQGEIYIVHNEDHGSFVYKSPIIGEIVLNYLKKIYY